MKYCIKKTDGTYVRFSDSSFVFVNTNDLAMVFDNITQACQVIAKLIHLDESLVGKISPAEINAKNEQYRFF